MALVSMLLSVGLVASQVFAEADIESYKLPPPKTEGGVFLETALQKRRSIRKFKPHAVTLTDVSQLLWAAQGITDPREGLRTAPSAGALYPLELYLVAGDIDGLARGVYHYRPQAHDLAKTEDGDRRQALAKITFGQSWLQDAPAVLVFTAVVDRTTGKYGERGIRYVYMEAGHAAQNVYLQAVSLGLGTVVLGAFQDADVRKVLSLEEDPLYLMPFGHPPK
jgi:SagB-type dehydrogenase family enzyme